MLRGLYSYVATGTVERKGLEEIYEKVSKMVANVQPTSMQSRSQSDLQSSRSVLNPTSHPTMPMPMPMPVPMIPQQYSQPTYQPMQNFKISSSLLQSLTNPTKPTTDIPNLTLSPNDINTPHPGLHYHLYEAIPLQCKQCGLRFSQSDDQDSKSIFDAHLDWHFRMKKKLRDRGKKTSSREWYVPGEDWVLEQPVESLNDQGNPYQPPNPSNPILTQGKIIEI